MLALDNGTMTTPTDSQHAPRKRGPATKPGSAKRHDPGFVVSRVGLHIFPRGWTVLGDRRALEEDPQLVPVRPEWLRKRIGPRGWDVYEYLITLRNPAGWVWALRSTLARRLGLTENQVAYRLERLRALGLVENIGWKAMGRPRKLPPLYVWRVCGQVGRFDDGAVAVRVLPDVASRLGAVPGHGGKRPGAGRPKGAKDSYPRRRKAGNPAGAPDCTAPRAPAGEGCGGSFLPRCNNQGPAQIQVKTSFSTSSLPTVDYSLEKEVRRASGELFSNCFNGLGGTCKDSAGLPPRPSSAKCSWKLPGVRPSATLPGGHAADYASPAGAALLERCRQQARELGHAAPQMAATPRSRSHADTIDLLAERTLRAMLRPADFDALGIHMVMSAQDLDAKPRPVPQTDAEWRRALFGEDNDSENEVFPVVGAGWDTPRDQYGGHGARFVEFAQHLPYLSGVLERLPRVEVPLPPVLRSGQSDDDRVRTMLEGYRMGVGQALGTRIWAYKTGTLPNTPKGAAQRRSLLKTADILQRYRIPPAFWAYWQQHRWQETPEGLTKRSGCRAAPLGVVFAPGRAHDDAVDWYLNTMASGTERTVLFTPTYEAVRDTVDRLWQDAARAARSGTPPTVAEWRAAVAAAFPHGLEAAIAQTRREADTTQRRLAAAVRAGQWVWQ